MNNEYKLYINFDGFLKDKILNGLTEDGYTVILSDNNNFIIAKILDDEYNKDNENYVMKIIMSELRHKRSMIKSPISVDISEKMNIWISKAKKNKNNQYGVYENNHLHALIRTYLTSLIIRNI